MYSATTKKSVHFYTPLPVGFCEKLLINVKSCYYELYLELLPPQHHSYENTPSCYHVLQEGLL